ncbi:hypothetical protein [Nocardioides perillae]|uniref:Uncharacterized protein n=1 Tax=Nocardioides perillae TaxID=1119534 RepID=A0A7Y9RYD6_9ACTN|nr:hypothetical protein [Nocardioides perillae]NYG56379.1 hypothetical protein [Nocardioides perillae]
MEADSTRDPAGPPAGGRPGDEPAGVRAGDVYAVALEPPGTARGRWRARAHGALLAVGAMAGWYDEPTAGELVVRRRDDGRELLRVDAGPSEAAAQLLAHVRRQLDELAPRELRDVWGALDPAAGASGEPRGPQGGPSAGRPDGAG